MNMEKYTTYCTEEQTKKLYDVWEDDIIIKSFETLEEANKWCVDNHRGDYIIKDNKVYNINI